MSTFILNITTICNQKCVFCLDGDLNASGKELDLSFEETKEKIDEAHRRKFEQVLFMGGETNILKHFPDIIGYVSSLGMRPWVATNGTRLDQEAFLRDLVIKRGLFGIELSYHSHLEETCNKLAGSRRTWARQEKAVRNIIALKKELRGTEHDFELMFNSVITSWTYEDLEGMVRHLAEVFDGDFFARIKFKGLRAQSRALENRFIVPRYRDVSPHLVRALDFAASHRIECFVETVPICFLPGHEHRSLETGNMVRDDRYGGWNFHSGLHTGLVENGGYNESYVKPPGCAGCSLGPICAGVWRQYLDVFDDGEFQAVDRDPAVVAHRVLNKPEDQRQVDVPPEPNGPEDCATEADRVGSRLPSLLATWKPSRSWLATGGVVPPALLSRLDRLWLATVRFGPLAR